MTKALFQSLRLPVRESMGLFLLRVVAGAAFMVHGYGKIQHPFDWMGPDATTPGAFQALAAIAELCGGLGWILGFLTPLASFGIACTMAVAVWTHARVLHDPFVASAPGEGSFEPASVYLCVALLLLFGGPGGFSLDRVVFGQRD
jgi:putative oxidoreductase